MNACRFVRFGPAGSMDEWVPLALRDATCLRRSLNPERWASELRRLGIEVSPDDCLCLQNSEGTWSRCPLYQPRPRSPRQPYDVPRNDYGFPLLL